MAYIFSSFFPSRPVAVLGKNYLIYSKLVGCKYFKGYCDCFSVQYFWIYYALYLTNITNLREPSLFFITSRSA